MFINKVFAAAVVVAVFALVLWSFMTKRELDEYKAFERRNHVFPFAKSNDTRGRYLGDQITSFLEDYGMGEDCFCRDFIETPARERMDEYRKEHPKPKD